MLNFFAILIGTLGGVILFLFLILMILYRKLKRNLGSSVNMNDLKNMIKESEESVHRVKTISGLTDILKPKILKDYPSFDENVFFNKVENSLKAVFTSLEDKKVEKINELKLIETNINDDITDLKNSNSEVSYDNIKFHNHVLKDYQNTNGTLCLTVESSLEYYYKYKKNNKIISDGKELTQTVYITKFVYIYDLDKYDITKTHLSAHCPNCGAPLKDYFGTYCKYCNSGIKPIDVKAWYLSEYKNKY